MENIDWDRFGLKSQSKRDSFEELSMYICCRDLQISEITAYKNQPGIETEPFLVGDKRYGFQAKFFESGFDWQQIKNSILGGEIKNIKDSNSDKQHPNNVFLKYKLDKLIIYCNKDRTQSTIEASIAKVANENNCKVSYITNTDLKLKLGQPKNLDLAQLYFGIGDNYSFIKNSTNPRVQTLLNTKEFVELTFIDKDNNPIVNISESILHNSEKTFLILGNPGSGKTIIAQKLLSVFGGLNKKDEDEMNKVLINNGAFPIVINLKNCASESLESILRGRKNDCKLNGKNLGFIYIFDGLDELSEKNADNTLLKIHELKNSETTKKIIITCRSGNQNRLRAKLYFSDLVEYKITELSNEDIDKYFSGKADSVKLLKLSLLRHVNPLLISEIRDILMLKILWENVDSLDKNSLFIDLFGININHLLDTIDHRKNIEELNLPYPKKQSIIEINEDIAFEMQKQFQFRLTMYRLKEIILQRFPQLDYHSLNSIIHYLCNVFFEDKLGFDGGENPTFVYQHRRYQEYFFTLRLKTKYEANSMILRDLNLVSNKEYLNTLFLPYLRKIYEEEQNINGIVDLNLINVYQGQDESWGGDEPYYLNSKYFIPALVGQDSYVFNELIEDENLRLNHKLSIDYSKLRDHIQKITENNQNRDSKEFLTSFWENQVSYLISQIKPFWSNDKQEYVNSLVVDIQHIVKLYEDNRIFDIIDRPQDPYFKELDSWLYFRIVVENTVLREVLNLVRKNYEYCEVHGFSYEESGRDKLIKTFLRICLEYKTSELWDLLDTFDEYEFLALLDVCKELKFLPIFIKSIEAHEKIKSFVGSFKQEITMENYFILFYRKFFGLPMTVKEMNFVTETLEKLESDRRVDWQFQKLYTKHSIFAYIEGGYAFSSVHQNDNDSRYVFFNELLLYSYLFVDYISILRQEINITTTVRNYIKYCLQYGDGSQKYLISEIFKLIGYIFAFCDESIDQLARLKNLIKLRIEKFDYFSFCVGFNKGNTIIFNKTISASELDDLEKEIINKNPDLPRYIDLCFQMSLLYAHRNKNKGQFYFTKGINDGILRHGWRKDYIVSYSLVDALEIILQNGWLSDKKNKEYIDEVFKLTLKVTDITDGKGTWQGPYNTIKTVVKYNIEYANELKKQFIKKEGRHNVNNMIITSILLEYVNCGYDIEEIEECFGEYRKDFDYEGKPRADYYEEKFLVYLSICKSDMYFEEERSDAFAKAYDLVEQVKKSGITYSFADIDFKPTKHYYEELCIQHKKVFNLTYDKPDGFKSDRVVITEDDFISDIENAENHNDLNTCYQQLFDYKYEIVLKNAQSWKLLVEKTYLIDKNLELFLKLLEKNYFPKMTFWSENSSFMHFGIAAALSRIETKLLIFDYLSHNTGHDGFINLIKAYEAMGEKEVCLQLFDRYIKFCKLIVN